MSFFGRETISTRHEHVPHITVGKMSDGRKHFHLENEIVRAIGTRESDIDEAQKFETQFSNVHNQGDFLTVIIPFGVTSLSGAFPKKFTNMCKKIQANNSIVEVFVNGNNFVGFRKKK